MTRKTPKKTSPSKATKPDTRPKTARPDPRNTDPAISAADPKDELFCSYIAQNYTGTRAYQLAINPKSKAKTAGSRASEMRRRPDLARRIIVLQDTTYKPRPGPRTITPPTKPPAPAPEQPPEATDAPALPNAPLITRKDLEAIISAAVRQASTATEKTQAVKLARDMLGLDRPENAPVDPVALVDYISRTAGRTPQEIAREAGGLRWLLDRVAMLSRQPRSQVLRTARAWVRDMAAEAQPTPPPAAEQPPE